MRVQGFSFLIGAILWLTVVVASAFFLAPSSLDVLSKLKVDGIDEVKSKLNLIYSGGIIMVLINVGLSYFAYKAIEGSSFYKILKSRFILYFIVDLFLITLYIAVFAITIRSPFYTLIDL
jgi:uncharacterized membrane-anchored protein YitT (DUF2179 family)